MTRNKKELPIIKTMKIFRNFDWVEFGETIWDIVKVEFAIFCALGAVALFIGLLNEILTKQN